MHIERAAGDWTGVLFIVLIVVAQLVNAMRKGKPPAAPEPRAPKPQPRTQAPPPPRRPDLVIPPFNPAPRPQPTPPRPDISAQTKADPESADLSGLLDRLRKLEAARESQEVVAETVRPAPPKLAPTESVAAAPSAALRLQAALKDRNEAKRAILLAEILQPPVSLRG